LPVAFSFHRQHIFPDLAGAFEFGYSEEEFTKLGRDFWVVEERVLLERLQHRLLGRADALRFFQSARVGGEEYDDFHGGVLELIDAQSAQMIGEVDHALDARAQTEGSGLLQRDGFAVRNADLARSGHRPVAAGEQQQLTPSVDQQRYLIIWIFLKSGRLLHHLTILYRR